MRLSHFIVVTLAVYSLSSPVSAAVVYLKTGEEIECESYRRQGDSVYVSINRETEIDFDVEEIDFGKTPASPNKTKQASATTNARSTVKAIPATEGSSATDETSNGRPFFGVPIPEDSTACTPELQDELLARFSKYNRAAEAGDFSKFQKHIIMYQAEETKKALAGLSKTELQKRRKVLQEMAVKNYRATACMVSPGAGTAAVAGRGKNMFQGKLVDAHGTISFKKENQSWKVQTTVWNRSM